jgi:hypothetical protein
VAIVADEAECDGSSKHHRRNTVRYTPRMDVRRLSFRVIPIVLLALLGLWLYARAEMDSRIGDFRSQLREQGYVRGGGVPSVDAVRERAEQLATERALTIDDLDVTVNDNGAPDTTGRVANAYLGASAPSFRYAEYTVTGQIHARRWLFGRDEPLQVSFSLRTAANAGGLPGMRDPVPAELGDERPTRGARP